VLRDQISIVKHRRRSTEIVGRQGPQAHRSLELPVRKLGHSSGGLHHLYLAFVGTEQTAAALDSGTWSLHFAWSAYCWRTWPPSFGW
jgi:hypothetical protein